MTGPKAEFSIEERAGPGEMLYVRVASEGHEGVEPEVQGSRTQAGGAYIAIFPFDVLTRQGLRENEVVLSEERVAVFPPFPNGEKSGLLFDQVDKQAVPHRPDAVPPGRRAPHLERFELKQAGWIYADAIRMDLYPDPEAEEARERIRRLLGLIRWRTNQWWIGHDRRHTVSFLRNWLPVNELGERLRGFQSFATLFGNFGFEEILDQNLFDAVCEDFRSGREIPLSWSLYFDGCFFTALGEHRRVLIDLATATEVAMATAVSARAGERAAKQFDKLKYEERLGRGLKKFLGRPFSDDHPKEATDLELLWIARGHVAHGKDPKVVAHGRRRPVDQGFLRDAIAAVRAMLQWTGST